MLVILARSCHPEVVKWVLFVSVSLVRPTLPSATTRALIITLPKKQLMLSLSLSSAFPSRRTFMTNRGFASLLILIFVVLHHEMICLRFFVSFLCSLLPSLLSAFFQRHCFSRPLLIADGNTLGSRMHPVIVPDARRAACACPSAI
jgi:hypothetical protein